jgi:DNA-binding NtrC family response regulator
MASDTTVLVVGDEALQRLLLQALRARYTVLTSSCWTQALDIRSRATVDVVVADATSTLRDRTNLNALCAEAGSVPCVLLASADQDGPGRRRDTRRRLLTFSGRSVPLSDLSRTLANVIADRRADAELSRSQPGRDEPLGVLSESRAMQSVMSVIDRAALCDTPVLLIGESGTGKELLARALHKKSPRADGPFVAVNCSAIPDALLESELFGHRRGAFTDAHDDRPGLFQAAQRGTVFLDEIGDMAPALQGKLLRVLQEKEVHPLGALAPVPVDARIITATHRDLATLVAEGRFRQDLLYRINVIEVHVPPLRDRPDDLGMLVRHLLDKHGAKLGKPGSSVSPGAMRLLHRHTWPGNVRELENVIERALVLGDGAVISVDDLPESLTAGKGSGAAAPDSSRLADVEREHIVRTIRRLAGNKAAAARALGLNRKTLYRKLIQHRIDIQ